MKYKKYIVFQFQTYYPAGGIGDITDSFESKEEAIAFIKDNLEDYNEIVDRDTWEIIE